MRRSRLRYVPIRSAVRASLLAGLLLLATTASGMCQSLLAGTITDAVTGRPVVGATIEILDGGDVVGLGSSDSGGSYAAPFTPPDTAGVRSLIARATHPDYDARSVPFQVRGGQPVDTTRNIDLMPAGLAACQSRSADAVVVGHFRAPVGETFAEVPGRVAEALAFNLLTRLQTVRVDPIDQPAFEPCADAQPPSIRYGKQLAQALHAHALLFGTIAREQPAYAVSTYVSDAYRVFDMPLVATSHAVDLDTPSEAVISAETHAAILAAIAAGLADDGKCETAVGVINVAEALLDAPPPYLVALRHACEAQLPHTGLMPGDGQ